MFFGAYRGDSAAAARWIATMRRHATWLGARSDLYSRGLADGREFAFGWLLPEGCQASGLVLEDDRQLLTGTLGAQFVNRGARSRRPVEPSAQGLPGNETAVILVKETGMLKIAVPPATPEHVYFAADPGGHAIGNDLRLLLRWTGLEPDEHGVLGLLRYGTIPAPFTLSTSVRRAPNGHVTSLRPGSAEPEHRAVFQPGLLPDDAEVRGHAEDVVSRMLDAALEDLPKAPVLYFSGGVDSGLLAAHLSRMGRKDVRLVNFAFGADDTEGQLAQQMADALGLEYHRVGFDVSALPALYARLGKDYSFPFGDTSTIPTNLLVHASLPLAESSRSVIDGTGADGAFGVLVGDPGKWRRLYSVPEALREFAGGAYRRLRLWKRASRTSRLARLGYALRESCMYPETQAPVVSHNPFDGIAYRTPVATRAALETALARFVESLAEGMTPEDRYRMLDLIVVCAGQFAAKDFDPLRTHGVRVSYPFLEPRSVWGQFRLGHEEKCPQGESKGLLKRLLVRSVPREMVYRSKSPFEPPMPAVFADPVTQELLRDVTLSDRNPLAPFTDRRALLRLVDGVAGGNPVSYGVYQFLWVLLFTSLWLTQIEMTGTGDRDRRDRLER